MPGFVVAAITLPRICGDTLAPSVKMRATAGRDMPASAAIPTRYRIIWIARA